MDNPRFFCRPITSPQCELSGPEGHHLIRVLRLRAGDPVELFDGEGTFAPATVGHIQSDRVTLQIESLRRIPPPASPAIILAPGMAKGERFDWFISKATELGVDRICPIIYERTVKLGQGKNILDRWQHLAIAAAKQCGRYYLPRIDPPESFPKAVDNLRSAHPRGTWVAGSTRAGAQSFLEVPLNAEVIVCIGPEGGFSPTEEAFLQQNHILPRHLTDTILRVETAGLAAAAILTAKRAAKFP